MKKFLRLLIYLLIISVLVLGLFTVSYVYLTGKYMEDKCETQLIVQNDAIATELSLNISHDYEEIKDIVSTNGYTYSTISSGYNAIKEALGISSDINRGYFESTGVYFGLDRYEYVDGVETYGFYTEDISFFRPSYIAKEVGDNKQYCFFKFSDYFIYFDSNEYLNLTLKNADNLKNGSYMLFETHGYIGSSSDKYSSVKLLYIDGIQRYDTLFNYDKLKESFDKRESGSTVVKILDEKTFFSYSPLLSEYNDYLLFSTIFNYDDIFAKNVYLVNTLIVLSICVFAVFILVFILFSYSVFKQEEDISKAQLTFFVRPFVIKVNSKGKILKSNKSCERNIENYKDYKSIGDFPIDNLQIDVSTLIKKQIPFTTKFKRPDKDEYIYVHFVPNRLIVRYVLIGNDVTKDELLKQKNERIALFNNVTSLPNGNQLHNVLNDLMTQSTYYSMNIALAAIDILEFAKVNNIYGFESANNLLRRMAETIDKTCSEKVSGSYQVFNIRTSQFFVLFKEFNNFNEIVSWSKIGIDKLSEPLRIKEDFNVQITPKIGIVNLTDDLKRRSTSKEIYDFAAKALSRSISSRLSKVSLYNSELSMALSRDQVMEQELKQAIIDDEFEMYFQPQFSSSKNKIVGFEALLRWNNPKYISESPEHYVTIAEKNGLIIELAKLINRKVFAFTKEIEGLGVSISLNVSPVQLLQAGFVNEILKLVDEFKVLPGAIAIEITETFLMENRDLMISKLRLLRERGIAIHLDDFGIGYSSMLYLKDLPVNTIKIDKEFTKYMVSDKVTRIIVSNIVKMGQSLNLDLICEGVENEKQKDILSKMGCDIIQGYFISKPIPPEEVFVLLEKYNGIKNTHVSTKKEGE